MEKNIHYQCFINMDDFLKNKCTPVHVNEMKNMVHLLL